MPVTQFGPQKLAPNSFKSSIMYVSNSKIETQTNNGMSLCNSLLIYNNNNNNKTTKSA